MKRLQKSFKNQYQDLMDSESKTQPSTSAHSADDNLMEVDNPKHVGDQASLEIDDEPESGYDFKTSQINLFFQSHAK
jgi:hypothetical protein